MLSAVRMIYRYPVVPGMYYYGVFSCSPAVARPPPPLLVVQQYTAVLFGWYMPGIK